LLDRSLNLHGCDVINYTRVSNDRADFFVFQSSSRESSSSRPDHIRKLVIILLNGLPQVSFNSVGEWGVTIHRFA
jgi:hypothetical protein